MASNADNIGITHVSVYYMNLVYVHLLWCSVMVEGLAHEVPEDIFCEAVLFAHHEVQYIQTNVGLIPT